MQQALNSIIPRSIERGPVEADSRYEDRPAEYSIPRSIERGPVEATWRRLQRIRSRRSIPRSIERGPVEAFDGAEIPGERGCAFRAQLSAAPLKQLGIGRVPDAAEHSALN